MPAHFTSFIATARSSGLIVVSQKINVGEAIEQILLVWAASLQKTFLLLPKTPHPSQVSSRIDAPAARSTGSPICRCDSSLGPE
jgi:hypothetical protein